MVWTLSVATVARTARSLDQRRFHGLRSPERCAGKTATHKAANENYKDETPKLWRYTTYPCILRRL